ncbi:tail assembly chaperone [Microbacterium phage SanaSana]|uniref:tail assembly chaperone n=1 Tax=Microbacterium phage Stoor TaxID=2829393 RepID=UPI0011896B99|nr:tail assembly chaperone [Microbacterium phage Stoor]YP_010752610.1 tail assembly chaperone [Microbacterium Phage DirtyBubble]QDP45032.1 tail assembly chaperone [Microbacterium Phage DirtyBubble]QTF81948.1 tail assembly chaperone [Microbacterium phage BabyYoda]QUE26054.1 tail assembly chaperone [Microbacterium phage Stoor]
MTFEVPASKRSIKQNQFQFKVPGDRKTYSIPKAKYLSIGQVEELSQKGGDVQVTDLLDILGQGDAREAVRTLDQEQLVALMEAWQADSGLTAGGILGLFRDVLSPAPVRQALQYDLLVRGRTLDALGTEALTWYDLAAFVKHLQRDPESALALELHGPSWSVEAQLLATIADNLAWANWQRAGKKHAPKPTPIPRPWDKPKSTALGSDPIPISEFDDWWNSAGAKKPPTE